MFYVRALPGFSSLLISYISLLLLMGIIALGVYAFVKFISATKDMKKIKEDIGKIVEILEDKD